MSRLEALAAALQPSDAAILADTLAAAEAAEAALSARRRGLVSMEALICASDRAYCAWHRASCRSAATGDLEMVRAATRARMAFCACDCI